MFANCLCQAQRKGDHLPTLVLLGPADTWSLAHPAELTRDTLRCSSPASSATLQGRAPIPAHTLPQWDASQRGFWQAAAVKLCQDWKCTAQTRHEHSENEKHYLQNMLLLPTSIPRLFLSSRFDFFLQTPSANKTSRDGSWDKTRLQALQKLSTFITLLRRTPSGKQRALMLSDKNQRAWDVQAPC